MPRRYTEAQKQAIFDMWRANVAIDEIAAAVGATSPAAIKTFISRRRREGADLPHRNAGHDQVTRAELADRLGRARRKGVESGRGNSRKVQILELRLAGHRPSQIATMLGIGVGQIKHAIADPDHTRHQATPALRKGRCAVCGSPTVTRTSRFNRETGRHEPVSGVAKHCDKHAREERWRDRATKESVVAYLQELGRHLDRTPVRTDLKANGASFSVSTVYNLFGKNGWTKALRDAGFVPREARGQDRHDDKATEVTWEQRRTVLKLGGALEFDGDETIVHRKVSAGTPC